MISTGWTRIHGSGIAPSISPTDLVPQACRGGCWITAASSVCLRAVRYIIRVSVGILDRGHYPRLGVGTLLMEAGFETGAVSPFALIGSDSRIGITY